MFIFFLKWRFLFYDLNNLKNYTPIVYLFFFKSFLTNMMFILDFLIIIYRKIVTNKEWCGSMEYYVNCQQTWAIENFFSHTLLHYCPKRNSYSYDSYCIRNMLAVLDHNHHKDREAATTMDGIVSAQCQVSRRTKQWVAYERKKQKNFPYIAGYRYFKMTANLQVFYQ